MMKAASHLPAWLIKRLPVWLARQCVRELAASVAGSLVHTRQLLVDVSVIHSSDARTGIQRVVRALLLQLLKAPPLGYKVCPVFATKQHGYCHAAPDFLTQTDNVSPRLKEPVQVQDGDIFLGLDLAAHLLPRHQAQLLKWKRHGVKLHVLVYDLLPLQHPEWFNPKTTRNFKRWVKWLAVYADSAICISETVKMELAMWLNAKFGLTPGTLPASSIVLGADIEASAPSVGLPPNTEFLLARFRNTPTVLMVGTLEPRKGHDQVLAAFELLWQQTSPAPLLVIAGHPGWKTEALQLQLQQHPQAGKRVLWLQNASDELLQALYAACRGVVVASRAEGFGLPLVEAALHGKPLLVRDLPVFREIKVPHVSYFDSDTPEALASALLHWMESIANNTARPTMPTRYSWDKAAAQLIAALGLLPHAAQRVAIDTAPATQGAFA